MRASQDGVIATVKNHLQARLTVGSGTAAYWARHVQRWGTVPDQGPWLFTGGLERRVPLRPDGLGHRFEKLARAAGLPEASLQRLRHTVGTYLVAQGKILQASQRLRHRDVRTTFRSMCTRCRWRIRTWPTAWLACMDWTTDDHPVSQGRRQLPPVSRPQLSMAGPSSTRITCGAIPSQLHAGN